MSSYQRHGKDHGSPRHHRHDDTSKRTPLYDGARSSNNQSPLDFQGHPLPTNPVNAFGGGCASTGAPHISGYPRSTSLNMNHGGLNDYSLCEQDRHLTHAGHHPDPQFYERVGGHVQKQESLHRSIQASTQMLYDVFDYTIGMLEELEKHENHKNKPASSGILSHLIPAKYKKPVDEVCTGIEVELQCLSIQMRYLPPEIIKNSRENMVHQVLQWAASRQELPYGPVDHYCRSVLEILLYDNHKDLPERHRPEIKATQEDVNKAMEQVARGRHYGDVQDKQFHEDSNKKAKLKKKRGAERPLPLEIGAERLVEDKQSELWQSLTEYLHPAHELMDLK